MTNGGGGTVPALDWDKILKKVKEHDTANPPAISLHYWVVVGVKIDIEKIFREPEPDEVDCAVPVKDCIPKHQHDPDRTIEITDEMVTSYSRKIKEEITKEVEGKLELKFGKAGGVAAGGKIQKKDEREHDYSTTLKHQIKRQFRIHLDHHARPCHEIRAPYGFETKLSVKGTLYLWRSYHYPTSPNEDFKWDNDTIEYDVSSIEEKTTTAFTWYDERDVLLPKEDCTCDDGDLTEDDFGETLQKQEHGSEKEHPYVYPKRPEHHDEGKQEEKPHHDHPKESGSVKMEEFFHSTLNLTFSVALDAPQRGPSPKFEEIKAATVAALTSAVTSASPEGANDTSIQRHAPSRRP